MMRLSAFLILLLVFPHGYADARGSVSFGIASLTVFSCAGARLKPIIEISPDQGATGKAVDATATRMKQGVWKYDFKAPSRPFWLSARSGNCQDEFPVVVVPGHTRHLYAFLAPLRHLTYSDGYWLEGCLPKGISKVQLRYPYGRLIDSAAIDDGCYYLFVSAPGTYELAITLHAGMVFRTSVTLKGAVGTVVRRDVTLKEIRDSFVP